MENISAEYLNKIARTFGKQLKIEMVDDEAAAVAADSLEGKPSRF
ncbi:hypothetical protein [Desmospora activa]|nr:hypothetical protein [Desmospora activa]